MADTDLEEVSLRKRNRGIYDISSFNDSYLKNKAFFTSTYGYLKRNVKDTPVLLLDDVLSELDKNRQNYLLNSIDNIQTIITCTGLDDFVNNRFHIDKIYKIINGNVFNEN